MVRSKDTLYSSPLAEIADFRFDPAVANVFADMINRSVPGYGLLVEMLGIVAARYAQADSRLYDLGCSLGAASLSMRHRIDQPGCRIIAVDNAEAMLSRCREYIDKDTATLPVETHCQDIRDTVIDNASVVVMNYTLQFLPIEQRAALIERIYAGLRTGGALIVAEKVVDADEQREQLYQQLHADFKRAQGYSELEISQKRTALENVLKTETVEQHMSRLHTVGFSQLAPWFQCLNFTALLAVK